MKRMNHIFMLFFLLAVAGTMGTQAQDAGMILQKMDEVIFSPKDKEGMITITVTDRNGKEKVREAIMLQKGPEKKLYRYIKPESQAGIATLTLPNSVMWLYMPALQKPKRISMLTKDSSFNNTDFSFEDMATTPYAERYTPEFIKADAEAYYLNLVPKLEKSNYSKVVVKINKLYGYPETMDFYDLQGNRFKEATYRYERVGKYWDATEVVMTDLEKNHSTKILISDVKYDQGLSDDLFKVENMKLPEKSNEN
jgi:outer membrane lipoprotein-sorting protein